MVGLAIGVPLADALEKSGKENFDTNTSEAAKASKFLAGQSGSGIELGISNARGVLAKLQSDKTSAFFDLFGAGNGGDIKMLQDLIHRKEGELSAFRANPTDTRSAAAGQPTAVPPQQGPTQVAFDPNALTSAFGAALGARELRITGRVEVTNLQAGGAGEPPEHGPAGRGRKL
jgi:hypothetical protein